MACSYAQRAITEDELSKFIPSRGRTFRPLAPLYLSAPLDRFRRMYGQVYYRPAPRYWRSDPYPRHPYTFNVFDAYLPPFYSDALNPYSAA